MQHRQKKKRSEHSLEGCSHRRGKRRPSRNEVMQNAVLYSAIRLKVTRSIGLVRCLVALFGMVWRNNLFRRHPPRAIHGMGKYALARRPAPYFTLVRCLGMNKQAWFADDAAATGELLAVGRHGFACVSWDTCLATFPREAMACGEAGVSAPS